MSFRRGKVFSFGHLAVPLAMTVLYMTSIPDRSLFATAAFSFFWAVLLIWGSFSQLNLRGFGTYLFAAIIDTAILISAFVFPEWNHTSQPEWLVLLFLPLYAAEWGLIGSLFFGLLSLVSLYTYHLAQETPAFWTGNMTVTMIVGLFLAILLGTSRDSVNRMVYYDSLTMLPNRRLLPERLKTVLGEANCKKHEAAVFFLDVDGFKFVNETMGHQSGDRLLQEISKRIKGILPKDVLFCRMGGDEFALLIPQMKTTDEASALAEKLLSAFTPSFSIEKQEVFVTPSIGIATYPENGKDAETLMRNADSAVYAAKEQGRNNYQFYEAAKSLDGVERIKMETMLRHALERDEFHVYFQPRLEIATGQLVCVEALVRWKHPERGMISPGEFIPIAEETGLITQLGDTVLRKACSERKKWTDAGLPEFRIAVNLSPRQFKQTDLPESIHSTLKTTGLPPDMLELEITESAAMQDVNFAILMLQDLKEMGLTIAIDDFGTGYSSLNYLKRFPIDILKIDRSFISGIHQDSDDAAIVRAIIAMCHSLKLIVTAEGVETAEQLQFLEDLRCNEIQGFLIGKPMSSDALTEWIRYNFLQQSESTVAKGIH